MECTEGTFECGVLTLTLMDTEGVDMIDAAGEADRCRNSNHQFGTTILIKIKQCLPVFLDGVYAQRVRDWV
jgi:hypothetical protein